LATFKSISRIRRRRRN